jgi:hypothetical protein
VVARAGRHAGCLPSPNPASSLFERVVLSRIACHVVRGNWKRIQVLVWKRRTCLGLSFFTILL